MKTSNLFSQARRDEEQRKAVSASSRLANMVLLQQELEGMEEDAVKYFCHFQDPTWRKPRNWLLPTEELGDLRPECVDCVLKHIKWFKAQIKALSDPDWSVPMEEEEDDLPM